MSFVLSIVISAFYEEVEAFINIILTWFMALKYSDFSLFLLLCYGKFWLLRLFLLKYVHFLNFFNEFEKVLNISYIILQERLKFINVLENAHEAAIHFPCLHFVHLFIKCLFFFLLLILWSLHVFFLLSKEELFIFNNLVVYLV